MSVTTSNVYADELTSGLRALLRLHLRSTLPFSGKVKLPSPESQDKETYPRVVVRVQNQREAVYQTGIYEATVEFECDVDSDRGTPAEARALFQSVLDFVQRVSLKADVNALGRVRVDGIVLGEIQLLLLGDRVWRKQIDVAFFGHCRVA
jgi:hypothetical protein